MTLKILRDTETDILKELLPKLDPYYTAGFSQTLII